LFFPPLSLCLFVCPFCPFHQRGVGGKHHQHNGRRLLLFARSFSLEAPGLFFRFTLAKKRPLSACKKTRARAHTHTHTHPSNKRRNAMRKKGVPVFKIFEIMARLPPNSVEKEKLRRFPRTPHKISTFVLFFA
jgi:hypothetical protein